MIWINRSGNPDLEKKAPAQLDNVRVCSEHFLEEDFASNDRGKRFLRPHALPIDANLSSSDNALACLAIASTAPAIIPAIATLESSSNVQKQRSRTPRGYKMKQFTPNEARLKRLVGALRAEIKKKNQNISRLKVQAKKKMQTHWHLLKPRMI